MVQGGGGKKFQGRQLPPYFPRLYEVIQLIEKKYRSKYWIQCRKKYLGTGKMYKFLKVRTVQKKSTAVQLYSVLPTSDVKHVGKMVNSF